MIKFDIDEPEHVFAVKITVSGVGSETPSSIGVIFSVAEF